MKNRLYRHLVFWLAFGIQDTLLEFTWLHNIFGKGHFISHLTQGFCFNLVEMPARLFFTYYALSIASKKPFKHDHNLWPVFLKLALGLFIGITLHRMGSVYYIIPHEYPHRHVYNGLWDIYDPPWMFLSLLDIGYIAGIAVAIKLYRMRVVSLKNETELIRDKLETELKFLKNQINPHFLFNTLNNIYALARKKSDDTPQVVVKLANLLRFMLYESGKDAIPILEEITILEDYIQLEKLRYCKRLKVGFNKEIDDYHQFISPLILLPFVENAFKHGVNESTTSTVISIHAALCEGQLAFEVKNSHNYDGNLPINESIGLTNVRRQLELMYTDFSLNITNLEQSFIVNLKINLNANGKL